MRKLLLLIPVALVACLVCSCEIEASSDGNLYGFWHLVRIDSIGREDTNATVDLSDKLIFWAIQVHLVELMDQDREQSPIVCRFERDGDSLFLDIPYYLDRGTGDPPVTEVNRMYLFGLGTMKPRLFIESLSNNKMLINTGEVRLRFKKL